VLFVSNEKRFNLSIRKTVTGRGRSIRLFLCMTCFKIIDFGQFPGSLVDDFKCSGRVACGVVFVLFHNYYSGR
jgi:hypothetical protein